MRFLKHITRLPGCNITIVLDGLDERNEGYTIAKFLIGLVQNSPSPRGLILSRKIHELNTIFANHSTLAICGTSIKPDIDTFLERNIRAIGAASSTRSTDQIIADLQEKADVSFLMGICNG
jgi:hypothetical protein